MSKVLITGSADGLGRIAAQQLVAGGHDVYLHARDRRRADEALDATPGAAAALAGDLASIGQTSALAEAGTPRVGSTPSSTTPASATAGRGSRPATASSTCFRSTCSRRTF